MAAAELLGKLLWQDIERRTDGVAVRKGVAQDRIVSVSDPEMRHCHKSSHRRFDGHKAALAVEAGSQLITAVAVLPGNAPDNQGTLDLVSESERNIGSGVCETRRQFAEAERTLVTKVPKPPRSRYFTKQAFHIDLEAGSCTCPAGEVTTRLHRQGRDCDGYGKWVPHRVFVFEGAVCDGCPLRPQCVKTGRGRSVSLHPQEGLLQEARTTGQRGGGALSGLAPGGRTSPGPSGAIGPASGALSRAPQDPSPTPAGGHRGQSHPPMGPDPCLRGAVGPANSPHPGNHLWAATLDRIASVHRAASGAMASRKPPSRLDF